MTGFRHERDARQHNQSVFGFREFTQCLIDLLREIRVFSDSDWVTPVVLENGECAIALAFKSASDSNET